MNTYPLYNTRLCEHIPVVTQRCIQKIIQEEDCSIKALQQEGKNVQLTYLKVEILSDQTIFCKAQNSPLSEGISMISSNTKKKKKIEINISELTLKEK